MSISSVPSSFSSNSSGSILGLELENAGSAKLSGGMTSFGQVFAQGEVAAGTSLVAKIGGSTSAVQMDVKTTYADGSVKMAVLTLARPDIAAGHNVDVVLSTGPVSTAPALDLSSALSGHSFAVSLTPSSGVARSIDVL
ncbi:hypothetical protein, partial [Roseomonas indoligenes]